MVVEVVSSRLVILIIQNDSVNFNIEIRKKYNKLINHCVLFISSCLDCIVTEI